MTAVNPDVEAEVQAEITWYRRHSRKREYLSPWDYLIAECEGCGRGFMARRRSNVYCKPACGARHRYKAKHPSASGLCVACGIKPAGIMRHGKALCSVCKGRANVKQARENRAAAGLPPFAPGHNYRLHIAAKLQQMAGLEDFPAAAAAAEALLRSKGPPVALRSDGSPMIFGKIKGV
jgi:hypothetical protein